MLLSRNIANLLSKQISILAVAQEVFGYDTEPEHRKFAEQADQHSSCCSGYGTELKNRKFAEQAYQSLIVVTCKCPIDDAAQQCLVIFQLS